MQLSRQPWLYSPVADSVFILAPAFVVTIAVILFSGFFTLRGDVTPALWLLLVVGIDVAHVYSTLFRTYFDPAASLRYRSLLVLIPIACWVAGVLLYAGGRMAFWRVLAYLAVFHFVRQQYGFLRLYARREKPPRWSRFVDNAAIYLATIYPLLYWHTHPRSFAWFLPGDFATLPLPWLERIVLVLYIAVLIVYAAKEVRAKSRNLPKHLLLAGTALSWYTGIVLYNGDLTFTVTNVVAHGVPYMALIWIYQRRQLPRAESDSQRRYLASWFRPAMIPLYLLPLVALAYLEEAFWDVLVWRDHTGFFAWLSFLPQLESQSLLALVVPLLAVPQATHYVLDGFIWRVSEFVKASPPATLSE